ncbi:hypothetical protein KZO01_09010 [Kurthia zopfii]|uniref:Uncharacterized protein n=1 Tax=Kurthia zopfii TaxID=1650 RepID=A0A8B4QDQ0_9BACL|nr:hypothetical protein [Kurthia zopfii]PWI22722.1 hypothetical protein DF281_06010 [Kurthia zopfii]TDR39523.1 hypothetical protein DFR61_11149 [Kurthia zopfii]GEK30592.1 hypothetical protein KZO01_09010 [Kurthia zopfii]STX10832.1 Uncharacterised protein [Kurthia zopfii]
MSGSSGIRGYYYQVLAGLLDSVENDLWESIGIEPSTNEDKVDIEWVFKDSIQAVQVKSSINNFERGSVINWVHSLVKDARKAYGMFNLPITYTLFLIGTTDRNADKWISDLHGGRLKVEEDNKLKEVESELTKVAVKKQNFDFEPLQALSYIRMQEYLSRNGKEAKLENIKTLCSVIVNELFTFSLQGRQMPKSLFTKLVDKHIDSEEYGVTPIINHIPKLSLAFYEKDRVKESDKMLGIHLHNTPLLNKHRNDAIKLLKTAKTIKLPPTLPVETNTVETDKTKSPVDLMNAGINEKLEGLLKSIPSLNGYIKVKLSEEDALELKELSKSILGIELHDEDLHFGGLEKRAIDTVVMFGPPRNFPRGTEDEKEKYYAIENAHGHLLSYQLLDEYTVYLNTCYPLPVILKNTGGIDDKEIQVTLKFPNTAQVVTPKKMKSPFVTFIEEFIHEDYVFNDLLIPARDHRVMEYEGTSFRLPVQKKLRLPYDNINYTDEDFVEHLESLFNYEHFREGNQDIIQYKFKSLNPSQNMAFPTFLLIQTKENVNIEYSITSKHLSRPIEGILEWLHPDNTKP